jgi:antiviral helicase SKI2
LAGYSPEEVVALLSCFVFQEKTDVEPKLTEKLEEGKIALIAISDRVEAIQTSRKLAASEFRMMKFGLMEVVYEWAQGTVSE